jgi:hypothetical protein
MLLLLKKKPTQRKTTFLQPLLSFKQKLIVKEFKAQKQAKEQLKAVA